MRGILFAMPQEMAPPFTQARSLPPVAGMPLWETQDGVILCQCGVGKVSAAMGAQLLIDRFQVTQLFNAGVAGCLYDFPVGTLVVASFCVQHDIDTSAVGDPLGLVSPLGLVRLPCSCPEDDLARLSAQGMDARLGGVATGDWFSRDFQRAAQVRDLFSVHICDMEAGAAAQVCLRSGVGFHALKVVSDHLFHPAQGAEYAANVPTVVDKLNQALAILIRG